MKEFTEKKVEEIGEKLEHHLITGHGAVASKIIHQALKECVDQTEQRVREETTMKAYFAGAEKRDKGVAMVDILHTSVADVKSEISKL